MTIPAMQDLLALAGQGTPSRVSQTTGREDTGAARGARQAGSAPDRSDRPDFADAVREARPRDKRPPARDDAPLSGTATPGESPATTGSLSDTVPSEAVQADQGPVRPAELAPVFSVFAPPAEGEVGVSPDLGSQPFAVVPDGSPAAAAIALAQPIQMARSTEMAPVQADVAVVQGGVSPSGAAAMTDAGNSPPTVGQPVMAGLVVGPMLQPEGGAPVGTAQPQTPAAPVAEAAAPPGAVAGAAADVQERGIQVPVLKPETSPWRPSAEGGDPAEFSGALEAVRPASPSAQAPMQGPVTAVGGGSTPAPDARSTQEAGLIDPASEVGGLSLASHAPAPGRFEAAAQSYRLAQQAGPDLAARITGQIAAQVSAQPDGRIEVRLDPAELGRVTVLLQSSGDSIQALVAADRPTTDALIRSNADQLERALEDAGFRHINLGFGDAGGQAGNGRQDADGFHREAAKPDDGLIPAVETVRVLAARGRLDLRL